MERAAALLEDDSKQVLARTIFSAGGSILRAFRTMQGNMKGGDSVRGYYVGFASGAYDGVLRSTLRRLASYEELTYIGLHLGGESFLNKDSLSALQAHGDEAATTYWRLVCNLVDARSATVEAYRSRPPGCLAPLIGPLAAQRKALGHARAPCAAMYAAEERRFASRSVYRCFDACAWVHLTAIREVLGLLYEVDFAEVPRSVQDVLRADFEGWGTSSVVENAFRAARALERASPSHRLAPHRVWHKPHEDEVFSRFDRPEIEATPEAAACIGVRHLSSTLFSSMHARPTIPADSLRRILRPERWATFTRASELNCIGATKLLVSMS